MSGNGWNKLPREHGTARGRNQHYRLGEELCGACRAAWSDYQRDRAALVKAEQEARRERWRQQGAATGESGPGTEAAA